MLVVDMFSSCVVNAVKVDSEGDDDSDGILFISRVKFIIYLNVYVLGYVIFTVNVNVNVN